MDWGAEALLDTIELIRGMGIRTIGAGRSLSEARQPAIIECKHLRIALLAYCSVLHDGYAGEPDKPGVAPLRARAHARYEPVDYQPGVPPRVVTIPDEEDLARLLADVRAAKGVADHVVLSLHWGVHFVPRVIADYQKIVAAAAIAAGADLILGHHAHVPKAIEVRDGRACFYSLSNLFRRDPDWASDVFKLLFAHILEGEVEAAGSVLLNPRRDADAARFSKPFEPGSDIHAIAENVAVLDNDIALVNADAIFDALIRQDACAPVGNLMLDIGGAA